MIMMANKRKQAAAILGPETKEDAEPAADTLEVISQELIDAVHSKDGSAVAACLKAAFSECSGSSLEESE